MSNRKSASDLMAELKSNSAFVTHEREREQARQELEVQLAQAEAPLLEALRAIGVNVKSVWDLVNWEEPYAKAIPVLFEHLKRKYPDRIREGILRALATPSSRGHWGDLVDFFEHNTLSLPPELRYLTAVALDGAADESVMDEVVRLVSNQDYGFDRAPLLLTLQRSANPRAKMLLRQLRDDPVLGKEVKKMRRQRRLLTRRPRD